MHIGISFMAKTIFEQMGGTYTMQGDYYFPDLILRSHLADIEEEAQSIFLRLVKEYAERAALPNSLRLRSQWSWEGG